MQQYTEDTVGGEDDAPEKVPDKSRKEMAEANKKKREEVRALKLKKAKVFRCVCWPGGILKKGKSETPTNIVLYILCCVLQLFGTALSAGNLMALMGLFFAHYIR